MGYFLTRRERRRGCKCNCEVICYCVTTVVNILEWDRRLGQNIKGGWVSLPKTLSSVETVHDKVGSADGFVPQAMQYLILWRVFVKSMGYQKLISVILDEDEETLQQIHMQSQRQIRIPNVVTVLQLDHIPHNPIECLSQIPKHFCQRP